MAIQHHDQLRVPKGLFFVGTDTGVGKTFVTAMVARLLRHRGHAMTVCKPVATGGAWTGQGHLAVLRITHHYDVTKAPPNIWRTPCRSK